MRTSLVMILSQGSINALKKHFKTNNTNSKTNNNKTKIKKALNPKFNSIINCIIVVGVICVVQS